MDLRSRIVAIGVWAVFAVACRQPDGSGPMRADSAGVEVVTNRRTLRPLSWTADTVRLLGGHPDGPEGFFRVRASLVDVDSTARIFVLDPTENEVAAFDTNGVALGAVGRKGQGPGELEYPLSLAVDPAGQIQVFDAGKGLLVRYSLDDGYLGTTPFTVNVIHNRFRHLGLGPGGAAFWVRDPPFGSDDRYDQLLWVRGTDTIQMVADKPAYRSTAEYPKCGMRFSLAIPMSPFIYWAQSGDRVAVSSWGQYRVDVFNEGRLVRSVRLGEAAAPLDETSAVAYLRVAGLRRALQHRRRNGRRAARLLSISTARSGRGNDP